MYQPAPERVIGAVGPSTSEDIVTRMDDHERQLQRLYANVFSRVREVVNEVDPEGLLAMGAPGDEYDDAVAYLAGRLLHHDLPDRAEIEAWFGTQYGVAPSSVDRLLEPLRLMARELPKT